MLKVSSIITIFLVLGHLQETPKGSKLILLEPLKVLRTDLWMKIASDATVLTPLHDHERENFGIQESYSPRPRPLIFNGIRKSSSESGFFNPPPFYLKKGSTESGSTEESDSSASSDESSGSDSKSGSTSGSSESSGSEETCSDGTRLGQTCWNFRRICQTVHGKPQCIPKICGDPGTDGMLDVCSNGRVCTMGPRGGDCVEPKKPAPKIGEWSAWGECNTVDFGKKCEQTRTRNCEDCERTETKSCDNGKFDYGPWSSCGDGCKKTRKQRFNCKAEITETADCEHGKDFSFSDWSGWTECPCFGGIQYRTRKANPKDCKHKGTTYEEKSGCWRFCIPHFR